MNIMQVGNLFKRKRKNPNEGRVYDPQGLAPALSCMGGGNRMPFVVLSYEVKGDCDRFYARACGGKDQWDMHVLD